MTTAAALAPRAPASSWVSRRWPANSVWASSDASTYSGAPGKCRAVHAAEAESADWNLEAGIGAPIFPDQRASVARLTAEVFVTIR